MSIFDDLGAEQERLEKILSGLDEAQWRSASAAEGWTIADVVLHLAQSEEAAAATVTHGTLRAGLGAVAGDTMDARADAAVRMERPVLPSGPAEVFARWQRARQAALAAMRAADPDQPVPWMVGVRLAYHAGDHPAGRAPAHGLDIAGPLGADFPTPADCDTSPGWRTERCPYALSLAGEPWAAVRCELTAPDAWRCGGSGRRTPSRPSPGRRGVLPGSRRSGWIRSGPVSRPAAICCHRAAPGAHVRRVAGA
jgi:uncharacterized protein (TIGR03083 family)